VISPRERTAADVAAVLRSVDVGGLVSWQHWDIPPRQRAHDFWLKHGSAQEALEVTTLMDQDTMTNAMHWQKVGPGFSATVAGLSSAWTVMVDPQFNAKTLNAGLAGWLRALEADGITETGRWDVQRIGVHP